MLVNKIQESLPFRVHLETVPRVSRWKACPRFPRIMPSKTAHRAQVFELFSEIFSSGAP